MAAGMLDAKTEQAARAFLARLDTRYSVREAIVFGSRARGDFHEESDVDVAVVLNGPKLRRMPVAVEMAGIAFDILLETWIYIDPLPIWENELSDPEDFGNRDLIKNILADGIRL